MRRLVGYVPDKPDCYDWMTAPELLRFLAPQYPTWDRDYADEATHASRPCPGVKA
jgi:ABC-type multidrug transport system ATPase subunit